MAKYHDIAEAITQRIEHGDYRLRGFPSHAGLVAELGVDARTVSRAISSLIDRGLLVRRDTGRVEMASHETRALHLGLLMPPWPSAIILQWYRWIEQACQSRNWSLRTVVYTHWHDAAISEAVRGLDGQFVLSIGDNVPDALLNKWRDEASSLVVLEQDVSAHNIPCLRCHNPSAVQQLIEHLKDCGVKRVHCLNTQPDNSIIRELIDAWQLWTSANGIRGELVNDPVKPFEEAIEASVRLATPLIRDRVQPSDAVLGLTSAAAVGAVRAAATIGRPAGPDLPIVSVDDWAGRARWLTPSLTCLTPTNLNPLIQVCLDYMERGQEWVGPFLLQPPTMDLFTGESTTQITMSQSNVMQHDRQNHSGTVQATSESFGQTAVSFANTSNQQI